MPQRGLREIAVTDPTVVISTSLPVRFGVLFDELRSYGADLAAPGAVRLHGGALRYVRAALVFGWDAQLTTGCERTDGFRCAPGFVAVLEVALSCCRLRAASSRYWAEQD